MAGADLLVRRPPRACRFRALALIACFLATARDARAQACDEGNLLEGARIVRAEADWGLARLSDGVATLDGSSVHNELACEGLRTVLWDLGAAREVRAAVVQADGEARFALEASLDGEAWRALLEAEPAGAAGLRTRRESGPPVRARFVRLGTLGDAGFSVSEVGVHCREPARASAAPLVTSGRFERPFAVADGFHRSLVVVLTTAGLGLLALAGRARGRRRHALLAAVGALAAVSYAYPLTRPDGRFVHAWDQLHYFMGAKYFPELGYFDLYRCIAVADAREDSTGAYSREAVRDLHTNELRPGREALAAEASCRVRLGARWPEFAADVSVFRDALGPARLRAALRDHGNNGTPLHTAVVRAASSWAPAGSALMTASGLADLVLYLLGLGALGWAFGARTALLAALIFGAGAPWELFWTGGALGRAYWFATACGALAALGRGRTALGGALLAAASFLRAFPAVLLLALLIHAWVARRRDEAARRRARSLFLGAGLGAAVCLAVGALALGGGVHAEFARVLARHSDTPMTNRIGLPALLAVGSEDFERQLVDPRLTDPYEVWKIRQRENARGRAPLRAAAVLLGLALVVWVARRRGDEIDALACGGVLLFSAVSLSCYDYLWWVLMVPAAVRGPRAPNAFVLAAVTTQLVAMSVLHYDERHLLYTLGIGAALGVLAWELVARLRAASPTVPEPARDQSEARPG